MMTASQMSAAIRAKKKKALLPDDAIETAAPEIEAEARPADDGGEPSVKAPEVSLDLSNEESEREKKRERIRASLMKARK